MEKIKKIKKEVNVHASRIGCKKKKKVRKKTLEQKLAWVLANAKETWRH